MKLANECVGRRARSASRSPARGAVVRAALISALRGASGLFGLLVSVVVSREYGATANGQLLLALAVVSIGGLAGALGTPEPVLRSVAIARGREPEPAVRQMVHRVVGTNILAGGGLAALTYAVLYSRGGGNLESVLLSLWAVPAASMLLVYQKAINGIGFPVLAEAVGKLFQQALLLVAVLVASHALQGPPHLSAFVVITYVSAAALSAIVWTRVGRQPNARPSTRPELPSIYRQGLPLLFTATVALLPQWLDVIMLSWLADVAAAGVYGVAARAAALIGLVLVGAGAIVGPRFARLHAEGKNGELQRLAALVSTWATFSSLALFTLLVVFRNSFSDFLGEDFGGAASVLIIAGLGQVAHVAFGMVALLLTMTGNGRRLVWASLAALAGNVGLNLTLIPWMGVNGAATAGMVSVLMGNTVASYFVWRELGVRPFVVRFR